MGKKNRLLVLPPARSSCLLFLSFSLNVYLAKQSRNRLVGLADKRQEQKGEPGTIA